MKYNLTAPPSSTPQNLFFDIPDLPASITPVITGTTPIDPIPNIAPTANAGSDITIQLPTNSIILNGSGNDPDGTIKNIQWSQTSGIPATIVNPNSLVTQVTGLAAGNYSFTLVLTDNDGASGSDSVNVTVKPAIVTGNVGVATGIATFNSIGIYWSGSGGGSLMPGTVKFRKLGDTNWSFGLDMSYDTRAIGGRPAGEYRGSIVYLSSGTTYEILLSAGNNTNTFTVKTWDEVFPEGTTTNLTSSTTITSGGTATAYKVFTGSISGGNNNIVVNAPYVIIRKMKLANATEDAIVFGANAHDVVVEDCDISGWGGQANVIAGNNQAAFRTKFTSSTTRLILQRNNVHDPRYSATGWSTETGGDHPYGVNAINLEGSGGNHVIRFNNFQADGSGNHVKRFMDGIGGADNFTTTGAPGRDSDIYCNMVQDCFDDGIEAEGGGLNIRIWSNFLNYTFTGIATATVAIGPIYVFNNVSNVGMRMSYVNNTEDRGPFNKCGSQDASVRGGRTYLFHNTVLQPLGNRGLCGGIVDNGGQVTNVVSINNIWTTAYNSKGGNPISMVDNGFGSGANSTSQNDVTNINTASKAGLMKLIGTMVGNPVYQSTVGLELNDVGYFLAAGSVGKGKALRINNFNDSDTNDVGAYNNSKLKFGI